MAGHNDILCAWISGKEAEYMEQLSDTEVGKVHVHVLRYLNFWEIIDT